MRQLHPKAFWLFFLQRVLVLVFIFLFSILPIVLMFGTFRRSEEAYSLRRTRPYVTQEDSYEDIFLRPFRLALKGFWIFVVFYMILVFIWAKYFYKSFKFEFDKKGLKIEKGVIWKRYVTIPYERIQNVDIYRGVFDRLLGLSDLHVQTAGYSGAILTEGQIPGLLPQDAEKLRDDLVNRIGKGQGL